MIGRRSCVTAAVLQAADNVLYIYSSQAVKSKTRDANSTSNQARNMFRSPTVGQSDSSRDPALVGMVGSAATAVGDCDCNRPGVRAVPARVASVIKRMGPPFYGSSLIEKMLGPPITAQILHVSSWLATAAVSEAHVRLPVSCGAAQHEVIPEVESK